MTEDDLDRNRRHFLTVATVATGAVGAGFVAVPFISSLKPSARAQALGAPVEVPLGSMQPGEMVRVLWRGKLVFVLRRDEKMLASLPDAIDQLRDPDSEVVEQQPDYAANATRSLKPEYLVVEGSCTHLGCAPLRVFKGVPAPTNLRVPPHRFVRDDLILIGQDTGAA
jgi:ubiquinol-cytochrome c reductase iron-sulfur subunit